MREARSFCLAARALAHVNLGDSRSGGFPDISLVTPGNVTNNRPEVMLGEKTPRLNGGP